jgi:hypothetical protein
MLFIGGSWFARRDRAYLEPDLNWSATVWDILDASRQRAWHGRGDRTTVQLLEDELPESSDSGQARGLDAENDDGGISVVRIVIDVED